MSPTQDRLSHNNHDSRSTAKATPTGQPIASPQASPSRRRQPSRASKDSPSKNKPSTSPTLQESSSREDDMDSTQLHPRRAAQKSRRASSAAASDDSRDLKLTRTGRISKALKGQRVHECQYCEKVFTRAEHCRRHQLNHGDPSVCEVPGCGKKFYREDLFARHKEEHKSGLSSDIPNSAYTSPGVGSSNLLSAFPRSPRPNTSQPMVTAGAGLYSNSQSFNYPTVSQAHFDPYNNSGSSIDSSSPYTHASPQPNHTSFSNIDYFPDYYVPNAPYYSAVDFSMMNASGSRSPASVSSSVPYAYRLEEDTHGRNMASPSNSDASFYPPLDPTLTSFVSSDLFDGAKQIFEDNLSFDDQDAYDENTLVRALATIPGLIIGPDGLSYLGPRQDQFMESYWEHFHPVFPVIHRPTFYALGCSPLLRMLILAIGAQYVEDTGAKTISRSLREVCFKLLEQRSYPPLGAARLGDLQAIFLAEAFSLFKSRRPVTTFSPRFEALSAYLRNATDVFISKPLDSLAELQDENAVCATKFRWYHVEINRRLFLATYILETQQSTLFASRRLIPDIDLPLPCSSALWEATTLSEWHAIALENSTCTSFSLVDALTTSQHLFQKHTFLSSLLIAYTCRTLDAYQQTQAYNVVSIIDQSPHGLFAYHASVLALHAPVRNILAVSGETFVLGEKLKTFDMFAQANTDLRAWATATEPSSDARVAVYHALQLLRIALEQKKASVSRSPQQQQSNQWPDAQMSSTTAGIRPFQEHWGLYLAALTIWSVAVWPSRTSPPSTSTSSVNSAGGSDPSSASTDVTPTNLAAALAVRTKEPKPTPASNLEAELSRFLADAENSGDLQHLTAAGTRATLEWVRGRCKGQLGGLIGDAWEVLSKLIAGSAVVGSN